MTPLLVELVGPAGAGKSALQQALLAAFPAAANGHSLWHQNRMALAHGAMRVAPAALAAARGGTPLVPPEMGQMVRLEAMERTLPKVAEGRELIVMDEGPVFALSWFDVFFGRNGDPGWSSWRRRMMDTWSRRLDAIVRVDAADAVLARRVNGRAKPHMMKHQPFQEVCGFNARFREAFDRVIGEMIKAGRVQVFDLKTDDGAPEALGRRLAEMIEARHGR